jgi:NADH pyrophosphatase NudC (nudix superfamily)
MAYIDREKAFEVITDFAGTATTKSVYAAFWKAANALKRLPDSKVEEVIHAKWEINYDGYYPYCSHCKTEPKNGVMSKYCPECGAKMDGGKE